MNWLMRSLKGEKFRVNSDFRPVGVFLSLSYWNALFSPYLRGIFDWFEGFSLQWSVALIALFTVLMTILFIMKPHLARQSIPYSIFTTGLAGMMFNLAVIFTFQSLYGYLFQHIGLLIAIFMSGVAWSSFMMTRRFDRIEKDIFSFIKVEIAIILFSFLFPFIFTLPFQYLGKTVLNLLTYPLFLIMSFLSGTWIGLQFPLSGKIYLAASSKKGTLGYTAGLLYGADLWGGFWGGLLGGILLLPILGLKASCFLIGILKISSGLLLILFIKIKK